MSADVGPAGACDEPIVTIIVPGRDVAPYVTEAVDSLRAQTEPRWRAVLVDDGSVDATGALFDEAAATDERFFVIHHPQPRGLGAARNSALEHVTTRYLGFLDADDLFTPRALEVLTGSLEDSGSDVVIGAYTRLRPRPDGGYDEGAVQPWVAAATSPQRRRVTLEQHPEATASIVAWAKVARTSFWGATRFPEGRYYEDQLVAQQLLARARAIDTVPDVVVRWRVRAEGSSITQRENEIEVFRDCVDAMSAGLDALADHPGPERVRIGQILRMDLPRLTDIAQDNPGGEHTAILAGFAADLRARLTRLGGPDAQEAAGLRAASAH